MILICAYRDRSLVNAPESSWRLTPLHLACWDSNKEVVELLLEAEADQDARCTRTLSKFLPIKRKNAVARLSIPLLREARPI